MNTATNSRGLASKSLRIRANSVECLLSPVTIATRCLIFFTKVARSYDCYNTCYLVSETLITVVSRGTTPTVFLSVDDILTERPIRANICPLSKGN